MPLDAFDLIRSTLDATTESYCSGVRGAREDLRRRLAAIDRSVDAIEYASRFVGVVSDWLDR